MLRFAIRFSTLAVLLFAVVYLTSEHYVAPVALLIARLVHAAAWPLGGDLARAGDIVQLRGFRIQVVEQCTAIYETALLWAAVLAYPATVAERLGGALLGTAALFVLNLVRVLSLLLLGAYAREWFTSAHLYVWQGLVIAWIAGYWLWWLGRLRTLA